MAFGTVEQPVRDELRVVRGWGVSILAALVLAAVVGCSGSVPESHDASQKPIPANAPNGVYHVVYLDEMRTINGAAVSPTQDSANHHFANWAFRTVCDSDRCGVTGIQLENQDTSKTRNPPVIIGLGLMDEYWKQNSELQNRYQQDREQCLGADGKVGPGSDTINASMNLKVQTDGKVIGVETRTVLTNECGLQGLVIKLPFTAERIGDVPIKAIEVEPAEMTTRSNPANQVERAALNGSYRIEFDEEHGTTNGESSGGPMTTQLWAFHSQCSAERCVAVGTLLDPGGEGPTGRGVEVLDFRDGRWSEEPRLAGNPCGSGWSTRTLSLTPQPDGNLRGTTTAKVIAAGDRADKCGSVGDVFTAPTVAIRIGDVPRTVVLADPSLFF